MSALMTIGKLFLEGEISFKSTGDGKKIRYSRSYLDNEINEDTDKHQNGLTDQGDLRRILIAKAMNTIKPGSNDLVGQIQTLTNEAIQNSGSVNLPSESINLDTNPADLGLLGMSDQIHDGKGQNIDYHEMNNMRDYYEYHSPGGEGESSPHNQHYHDAKN